MYFLIFLLVSAGFLEHMKLSRSCFKTLQTLRLSVLQQARCMDSCNSPLNINTCILFASQFTSRKHSSTSVKIRDIHKNTSNWLSLFTYNLYIYVCLFIYLFIFCCKHVLSYFSEASVQWQVIIHKPNQKSPVKVFSTKNVPDILTKYFLSLMKC